MIPSKFGLLSVVNAKKSSNRPKRESTSSIFAETAIEKDLVSNIEPIQNLKEAFSLIASYFSTQRFKSIVGFMLQVNVQLFFIA